MVTVVLMEFGKPNKDYEVFGKEMDVQKLVNSWVGFEVKGLGIIKKSWLKDNKIYGEIDLCS